MIIPVVKALSSPDVAFGQAPPDSVDCAVVIEASIGPKGHDGAERFQFVAITPAALARDTDARWGRGYLILDRFSWAACERAIEHLCMHAHRPTWAQTAAELSKEMHWEFENYTPYQAVAADH